MRGFLLVILAVSGCDERALGTTNGDGGGDAGGNTPDMSFQGPACGTRGGADCPPNAFCEMTSQCGAADSGGRCVVLPGDCSGANSKQPECGCDGMTYPNQCERRKSGVSMLHAGACKTTKNACEAVNGYCDPGDFVQPMCKAGYVEDELVTKNNPGVCGLGICCVPFVPPPQDCRKTGCNPGSKCDACLGPMGVVYVCLPNGAAC
jgi:hypothetical protein